jgi:putative nucleotide binding protein
MEEYAYVLDYLPYGASGSYSREPKVQLVGENFFTLLEATVKPNSNPAIGSRVYVGKDSRDVVEKIKKRLSFNELTAAAKDALPNVLRQIIMAREKDFIKFINTAGPISVRVHQLDLIPGIGKKNMEILLEERAKKPFEDFAEVKKRVPTWLDPIGSFVERIMSELEGKEKHYFFAKPFIERPS